MKNPLKKSPIIAAVFSAIVAAAITVAAIIVKNYYDSQPKSTPISSFAKGDNYDDCYYDYLKLYALYEYSHNNPDDSSAKEWIEQYEKNQAIKEELPAYLNSETANYYILFRDRKEGYDCKRLFCLEIGYDTSTAFKSALKKIEDIGYDAANFEIIEKQGSFKP